MSLEEGWNHIRIPKEVYEVKSTGVTDWNSALNHYIIVMPAATGADGAVVYWAEIGMNRIQKNYACLCFDDGFAGVYDNLHPWLVEQNIPANLFMPVHRVDTEGYLTTTKINNMANSGMWEICNHSINEPNNLNLATPETQIAEYTGCRDWIIANGWNRKGSAETFATPGAGLCWDTLMLNRLKDAGCKLIRTNRNFISNALPIANIYSIAGYSCSYTTALADVLTAAKAAKTGSLFVVYGHNPVVTASAGLEVSVALLKNIISSMKAMGYTFVKFMDWYETTL
jgi:peptidoglycan/xylan/chitin deacetylase (PgdA/CDA1 family)